MEYRKLGRTGLEASVIGFGAEWIGKMEQAEVNAMAARGAAAGVNIVDCWMSDPAVRSALGEALEPTRDQWIIQGHIGSTWQDGQYVRTRELGQVRPAFEDLLERLRTDRVELGMSPPGRFGAGGSIAVRTRELGQVRPAPFEDLHLAGRLRTGRVELRRTGHDPLRGRLRRVPRHHGRPLHRIRARAFDCG